MKSRKGKISKEAVFDYFVNAGNYGAIADDAVTYFGARFYSTVTARITELRQAGRLITTGAKRVTRRGGRGAVLKVAPQEFVTFAQA